MQALKSFVLSNTLLWPPFRLPIIFFALACLQGCISPIRMYNDPAGFLNCLRLDRDPPIDELDPRCAAGKDASEKTGTFHRDPDRELDSDILLPNLPVEQSRKLPVSDCLWVGSSQFGAGDVLAPQWESFFNLSYSPVGTEGRSVILMSSCRLDPPLPRSLNFWEGRSGYRQCWNEAVGPDSIIIFNDFDLTLFKSTCDVNDNHQFRAQSTLSMATYADDGYGLCEAHQQPAMPVSEYPDLIQGCSQIESFDNGMLVAQKRLMPREDAQYLIRHGETRTLWPRVRTVVNERTIARPLTLDNSQAEWQIAITGQNRRGRRWHENFSSSIRVNTVRVFSVSSRTQDDRQYLMLDGATLLVTDADNGDAVTACPEIGGLFDMLDCGLSVTPAFDLFTLDATSDPLTTPLTWSIIDAEFDDQEREYFIEFSLDSVFRTRTATLLASTDAIDFGELAQGDVESGSVIIENVGGGAFIIDSVDIDPAYRDANVFSAMRLDDPIQVPHPVVATDNPDGSISLALTQWETPADVDNIRQVSDTWIIPQPRLDGSDLEVLGVPLAFTGNTPVVQVENPDVAALMPPAGSYYPLGYRAYQTWSLPYTLRPNQQRRIVVETRPQQAGVFNGRLVVSGYPAHDPSARQDISVFIKARGMIGAQADVLPQSLNLPLPSGHEASNAVVISWGDTDLIVHSAKIMDASPTQHFGHAAAFSLDYSPSGNAALAPGSSDIITVRYLPSCVGVSPPNNQHEATLKIETSAGDFEIPLSGDLTRWLANNPHRCSGGF